jgi:hypothetical protein
VKRFLQLALVTFSLSILANADSFVVIGSRADQNPTDIIDWNQLGPDGTLLTSPQAVSTFNGNSASVGNTTSTNFIRADQGTSWNGNFDFGESLIWTGNPAFTPAGPGPLELSLATAVQSFGFAIQADEFGAFGVDVQVFDAAHNLLTDQTFTGNSDSSGNGSALFVGLGDTTGGNISDIVISTSSADASFANDFAIDDPSFTYGGTAPVPEPRSMAILLSALLGVAGVIRRFRK